MNVVTVFGGSGFIGRYVVSEIAKTGARVRVAVRRPELAGFLKPMGDVGQIIPISANIRNKDSVASAIDGADTVINLVGILYPSGKQTFQNVQTDGAETIAKKAKAAGVKTFVHVSALGADQTSSSLYAATKGLGEQSVVENFPSAIIFRPSIVFGPEDNFFNRFAALACKAPVLPLICGGRTKFQPVYVGDLASAIRIAAQTASNGGKLYEVGGPHNYSFRELIEIILRHIDRRRLLAPIPYPIAMAQALFAELLPVPIVTRDQVRLLKYDNILSGKELGLDDLAIKSTALETILPTYLNRYRRGVWHT